MSTRILAAVLLVGGVVAAVGLYAAFSGGDDPDPPGATVAALGSSTTTTGAGPSTSTTSATLPQATTTRPPRTTTTTLPGGSSSTTTRPGSTTTTQPGRANNQPPVVTINSPGSGQRFEALYNAATGRFVAVVGLSASVSDPDGDSYTVEWFSSDDGFLGSGQSISAALSPVLDTGQPTITARVTDAGGAVSQASVSVIVWIRSDE